ncbi:MAG TPA: hypothetical protein VMT32_16625 [Bryobacteraceae bacterium]|nr:hypothetical protein [Bryobacteraceae bacterium]
MKTKHSERGGVLAGILLALLILAALAVVGVFMAGMYFAENIHVEKGKNSKGETVQVETPIGTMRVQHYQRLDPKVIGVPVYPGAVRRDDNGAASIDFSFDSAHKEFTILAAEYSTNDSVERVREFYHRELPHWMISEKRHGGVQMEYTEEGYKRIVSIREQDGQTRIGLASVGEPAAN